MLLMLNIRQIYIIDMFFAVNYDKTIMANINFSAV